MTRWNAVGFATDIARGKPALALRTRPLSLALRARRASQDGGRAGTHRVPSRPVAFAASPRDARAVMRVPSARYAKTLTDEAIAAAHSCLRDARDTWPERAPDHPPPLSLLPQTEKAYQKQVGVNVGYVSTRRVSRRPRSDPKARVATKSSSAKTRAHRDLPFPPPQIRRFHQEEGARQGWHSLLQERRSWLQDSPLGY